MVNGVVAMYIEIEAKAMPQIINNHLNIHFLFSMNSRMLLA